jgi:pyruvate dehydrogenase E2 component (dihydrolipoamide acetyltransferase)
VKVVVEPPSRRVAEPRVKASPLARKIAVDRGLDLARIHGSGPEGRIVAKDLDIPAAATMVRAAELPSRRAAEPFSDVPLSQVRKTIAKRLVQSIGPIPTFYLTTEVDMERVAEAREALNESARRLGDRAPLGSAPARPGREGVPQGGSAAGDEPVKVSFNDIIIKATALALLAHPACNAWWQEDRIRYWNEVHISVAVAIEDGLITPVVRNADRKSLRELAGEVRDLVARARERRLQPEEYTGGTFSISNLGMFDIDEFTAVINPPEAGILAIGSVAPRPVVEREGVVVRRRMRITMSCDHRVIDGAAGAAFLRTLKQMLENPLALVW